MTGSLQKLAAAHGMLWDADPWYRRAWVAWPQMVSLLAAAWLVLHGSFDRHPISAPPPWAVPQQEPKGESDVLALSASAKTDAATRQIMALRDSAKTDDGDFQEVGRRAFGGDLAAQFALATLYDPMFDVPKIVSHDVSVAVSWYNQSAAKGNTDSARLLGLHFRYGVGVPTEGKVAQRWLHKAADAGDAYAENEIGVAYLNGMDGLTPDPAEAVKWFQKAAAQGNAVAAKNLALALTRPQPPQPINVPPPQPVQRELKGGSDILALSDSAKTDAATRQIMELRDSAKTDDGDVSAVRQRAFSGDLDAGFALGTLYDPMFDVPKIVPNDVSVALSWYNQSAAKGNTDSADSWDFIFATGSGYRLTAKWRSDGCTRQRTRATLMRKMKSASRI